MAVERHTLSWKLQTNCSKFANRLDCDQKALAWITDRPEPEVQQGFHFTILNHNSMFAECGDGFPLTPYLTSKLG